MNSERISHWAAAAAVLALLASPAMAERGGGHGEGRGRARGQAHAGWHGGAPVAIKMRRYQMPAPHVIQDRTHVVTDNRHIVAPRVDDRGMRLTKPRAIEPPAAHARVVRNTAVINNIRTQQRVEVVPNRYYWHNENGVRYAHYYDDHGVHWYGFYHGPHFYWTRYHGGYWWWWDLRFARWVYWWDGYWWWEGPGGGMYVYVDNAYYPYQDGVVVVKQPVIQAPPSSMPAVGEGRSWTSSDGKRMVQLYGDKGEAFLYDNSTGQPAFLKYLGTGVKNVKFSKGSASKPSQILLEFKDDSFALFDEEGDPIDNPGSPAVSAQPPLAPPSQPESVPPPPDAAPGEAAPGQ